MEPDPPDVVILGVEWRFRALLRAQLIEEGLDVLASDNWTTTRRCLRPPTKPNLVVVDVLGLPDAERILTDLRILMTPTRVLVVLPVVGGLSAEQVKAQGFHVVTRPITIGRIAEIAAAILRA